MKKKIKFIAHVCGAGGSTPGAEQGPVDVARSGIVSDLNSRGLDVEWEEHPDSLYNGKTGKAAHDKLPALGSDKRKNLVLWHCRNSRDAVMKAMAEGSLPVMIGGDHAMAAGSIAGLALARKAHGRIGLIWVDAHPDLNTPDTSPSGALHGMPVAALLGMGDDDFKNLGGDKPVLRPEHVCYIGIRDIDPDEKSLLNRLPINSFPMKDIKKGGVKAAFDRAMASLAGKVDYLVLSLDMDVFDPKDAPSVGTPVQGGFDRQELLDVLADLARSRKIDLIEVAEYNPTLKGKARTRLLLRDSLRALLAP